MVSPLRALQANSVRTDTADDSMRVPRDNRCSERKAVEGAHSGFGLRLAKGKSNLIARKCCNFAAPRLVGEEPVSTRAEIFKWRQTEPTDLCAVRWYLRTHCRGGMSKSFWRC